jgi:hypothetical protein
MVEKQKTRARCLVCKRLTEHDILHDTTRRQDIEEAGIISWDNYEVIQCRGCKDISFTHVSTNTEETDEHGQLVPTTRLYPSRETREPINDYYYFPAKVLRVYKETLTAISNRAKILAAVGLRAVVEGICEDKKCKGGNLETKINELVRQGALSNDQADFLHLQRFMRNDAAHEIEPPATSELEAALSIVENLLTTLYVLPETAAMMKRSGRHLKKMKARLAKPKSP